MTSDPLMATLRLLIAAKARIKNLYRYCDELTGHLIWLMQYRGLKEVAGCGYRARLVAAKPREYGCSPAERKRRRKAALGEGWTYSAMDLRIEKMRESVAA
jgi:hypothetical protein